VAVVFRYERGIGLHAGRAGDLPKRWRSAVYVPTWDNLTALVDRLARSKGGHAVGEGAAAGRARLLFRSRGERMFVLGFPESGRRRVKATPYHALREVGGADWEYRAFLESRMGASQHFTGTGACKPTISAKSEAGAAFPEFLGPNRKLKCIRELAVISLGTLKVTGEQARGPGRP
jgi:hypothetical protein